MPKTRKRSNSVRHKTPAKTSPRSHAERALLAANQRFQSVLYANEVATWTWDMVRNRVVADQNLARMFDLNPKDAVGPIESFMAAIHPDDRFRLAQAIRSAPDGANDCFESDYRLLRKDGRVVWITIRGKVERDRAGKPKYFFGVVIDVTSRKISEQKAEELYSRLERQSRIYDASLSSITDFAYIFDARGRFIYVNQALLDLWGLKLENAVGKDFYELKYPEELAKRLHEQIQLVFDTKAGLVDETQYTSPTGMGGYYEYIFSPVFDSSGKVELVAGLTRDITQRKREEEELKQSRESLRALAAGLEAQVQLRTAELEKRNSEVLKQSEELRQLSLRLMQTQDQEGRRLARELHDSVGQLLAAIAMNVATVKPQAHKLDQAGARAVEENGLLVETILAEIRTISYLLHPPLLDELGLRSALQWLVEGFADRSKIDARIDIAPDFRRLSPDLETAVFRVVQECLANIHRHSASKTATVAVTQKSGHVNILVYDEGKGIDTDRLREISDGTAGVGFRGMRERLRHFGGTLDVRSGATGTKITATLPIESPAP
jgi:PAS domain S-box-containing protein